MRIRSARHSWRSLTRRDSSRGRAILLLCGHRRATRARACPCSRSHRQTGAACTTGGRVHGKESIPYGRRSLSSVLARFPCARRLQRNYLPWHVSPRRQRLGRRVDGTAPTAWRQLNGNGIASRNPRGAVGRIVSLVLGRWLIRVSYCTIMSATSRRGPKGKSGRAPAAGHHCGAGTLARWHSAQHEPGVERGEGTHRKRHGAGAESDRTRARARATPTPTAAREALGAERLQSTTRRAASRVCRDGSPWLWLWLCALVDGPERWRGASIQAVWAATGDESQAGGRSADGLVIDSRHAHDVSARSAAIAIEMAMAMRWDRCETIQQSASISVSVCVAGGAEDVRGVGSSPPLPATSHVIRRRRRQALTTPSIVSLLSLSRLELLAVCRRGRLFALRLANHPCTSRL